MYREQVNSYFRASLNHGYLPLLSLLSASSTAALFILLFFLQLQVTVESVHVRYEQIDTTGTTIAAGVTLDGFTV